MASYWPTAPRSDIADYMNALPKFVFSRTLKKADWNNTTLVSDDAPAEVRRLKHEEGKDIFLLGSADLASSLMSHGLFDELRIGVTPHLLGAGSPLFKRSPDRTKWKFLDARPLSTGAVILRYEPVHSN
jgi:dihydrofolate reductase